MASGGGGADGTPDTTLGPIRSTCPMCTESVVDEPEVCVGSGWSQGGVRVG